MPSYNKHYKTENLFGEPYPELMEFFKKYEPKGRIVDLGCGQGRNAIPLARFGYTVTGIDISHVGIKQMNTIAENEKLKARGSVGDIYSFDNYRDFDIVLLDSMFHFEKRDKTRETELIDKISHQINKNSLICICIQDTGKKVTILKDTINNNGLNFEILNESSFVYHYEDKISGHRSETRYHMLIMKKV